MLNGMPLSGLRIFSKNDLEGMGCKGRVAMLGATAVGMLWVT